MDNLILSIVIAGYNAGRKLEMCLDSIYPYVTDTIQVIFVDDGSTDNTAEICRKYTDKLTYILQPHQGVSVARNTALQYCKGRYVSYIDADDYIDFEKMETVLQRALERDADVISFGYRIEFYKNNKLEHWNCIEPIIDEIVFDKNGINNLFSGIYGIGVQDYLRWCNGGALKMEKLKGFIWCFLWKNSIIQKNKIHFPLGIVYNEDAIWGAKFFLHVNDYFACNEIVYHYTRYGTGATVTVFLNNEKMAKNKLALLREKEKIRDEYFREKNLDLIDYLSISNVLSIFETAGYCVAIKGGYALFYSM